MLEKILKFILTTDAADVMKRILKIVIHYFTYNFKCFDHFILKRVKN